MVLNKAVGQQTRDPGVCFNSEDHRFGFQFSCLGRAQLSVVPGCSCTLGSRRGKRSIRTQLCPARAPPCPQQMSAALAVPPSEWLCLPQPFPSPLGTACCLLPSPPLCPGCPRSPRGHSLVQQICIEHLLCAWPCSQEQGSSKEGSESQGKRQTRNKMMPHPDWSGGGCLFR